MAQNLVQAKEDRLPIETIDAYTNRAENALKDRLITDCTEEEIKPKLTLIFSMVGLRPQHYPTGDEKQNLHDYLRLKFANKTLSELVLAFDLAINNELELKPEEVKIYDQFTIAYLAQIMAAYKSWLYNIYKNRKPKEPAAMINEKKTLSDEEKKEWIDEWKIKENINIELIPLMFYDYLSSHELLPITNRQKWEYTQKAQTNIKTLLHEDISICKTNDALIAFNKFQQMEKDGFEGVMKERILNRAKRLIVYDYLKGYTNVNS